MIEIDNHMTRPIEEPKVVYHCDECGEDIYEGDTIYIIRGDIFCECCIKRAKEDV